MTQVPWRQSVKQHDGEAIASLVIRLAPVGLLTPGEFLKYHFDRDGRMPPTDIGDDRDAVENLALIGGFDVDLLYRSMWKLFGSITEFAGRRLPAGWFKPELRRLAPGRMCADGDDPWVRNEWQIRALPCDLETGEIIIERCVRCSESLAWGGIKDVCSCGTCGFDQRQSKPHYAPADVLTASKDLGRYLRGESFGLPYEMAALADHEFLSLISWLAYFVALPECVSIRPSPHDAVTGFRLMKQWPHCFDGTVDEFVRRLTGDPEVVDDIGRVEIFEQAVVAVGRVGSKAAQALVEDRLITRLRLRDHFDERKLGFISPVARFGSVVQRFKWSSPSEMDAMRSSHDRTRRRPPSSRT
jgi:hypothetical protein